MQGVILAAWTSNSQELSWDLIQFPLAAEELLAQNDFQVSLVSVWFEFKASASLSVPSEAYSFSGPFLSILLDRHVYNTGCDAAPFMWGDVTNTWGCFHVGILWADPKSL